MLRLDNFGHFYQKMKCMKSLGFFDILKNLSTVHGET